VAEILQPRGEREPQLGHAVDLVVSDPIQLAGQGAQLAGKVLNSRAGILIGGGRHNGVCLLLCSAGTESRVANRPLGDQFGYAELVGQAAGKGLRPTLSVQRISQAGKPGV
jgi:hypothetical protein